MAAPNKLWWQDHALWIEAFAALNITCLTFDIYLAHSVNQFRRPEDFIPLIFSAMSPFFMLAALTQRKRRRTAWESPRLCGGGGIHRDRPHRSDPAPPEPLLL